MRKDAKNLIGNVFGKLTVFSFSGKDKHGQLLWLCKCECGNKSVKVGKRLLSGKTKSCGCSRAKNLCGNTIGYWLVLKRVPSPQKTPKWLCRCVCGVERGVWASSLHVGKSSSCGCKNIYLALNRGNEGCFSGIHNLSKHPLYGVYKGMISRCCRASDSNYKWYGAKGISVCAEWLNSFETFYEWAISKGYQHGLTIERIDPKLGYYPKNCEWITRRENSSRAFRNKHTGKIFNGWECVEKIPFTTQSVFECIKCKNRKQVNTYYGTSKMSLCKCT